MNPYADIEDYEAKFGALSGDLEASRVSVILDDAALFVGALADAKGIDAEAKADALRVLCLDYAHNVYEDDKVGALSALTHQAGSFSETQSFRSRQRRFDLFARDYYSVLGVVEGGVCFAWPGGAS